MTNSTDSSRAAPLPWDRLLAMAASRRARLDDGGARAREVASDVALSSASTAADTALYLPLVIARAPFALAHLGQSIDGCIATASGHSLYVTGAANLVHLHRLRALSDAILVGAGTAAADDPALTVRRVDGDSPVRVVLDRRGSLPATLGLFRDDGPQTLQVIGNGRSAALPADRVIEIAEVDGRLDPAAVREALAARGLAVLFLEGGGITVSAWLRAAALDRLHVAIAPVIIGAGRRGLDLPSAVDMPSALRPPAVLHRMGDDVLWDLDLGTPG